MIHQVKGCKVVIRVNLHTWQAGTTDGEVFTSNLKLLCLLHMFSPTCTWVYLCSNHIVSTILLLPYHTVFPVFTVSLVTLSDFSPRVFTSLHHHDISKVTKKQTLSFVCHVMLNDGHGGYVYSFNFCLIKTDLTGFTFQHIN